jgi:hypothetical protein
MKIGKVATVQPTSEKDSENRPISHALERFTIRRLPQPGASSALSQFPNLTPNCFTSFTRLLAEFPPPAPG